MQKACFMLRCSLTSQAQISICACKGTTFSRTAKTFRRKFIKNRNFSSNIWHFARFALPLYPVYLIIYIMEQNKTLVNIITEGIQEKKGSNIVTHVVGLENAQWVAMDYSDVLVHIFLPDVREYYDLEHLWEDAKLTRIPDLD